MDVASLSGEIGKCLQWLRKSLLLTQYQLASFTELDYRHYQNIETGRVEVKVETLKRICSTFGISLSTFFFLLDRRPWLVETTSRNKGGDFYLFRILLEQARFRVIPSVRELLFKSGRDLAEGCRDALNQTPFPCVEADFELKILWKNRAAATVWNADPRDELSIGEVLATQVLRDEVDYFWTENASSFYLEIPLRRSPEGSTAAFAVIGLRPMLVKTEQSVFLAFLKLGVDDFANVEFMNLQNRMKSSSSPEKIP